MEGICNLYALLFWFVGERNWTIQSTSTIVKPRREPEEYGAGDVVCAKFHGKPYRAAIVKIKESKEQLLAESLELDGLLKDMTLSPAEVLTRMGVQGNCDLQDTTKTTASTAVPEETTKRKRQVKEGKKKKGSDGKSEDKRPKLTAQKAQQKLEQQKERQAALSASKMMAQKLLHHTDNSANTSVSTTFASTLAPAPTTHAQPATSTPTSTHSLFGSTVTLAPAPLTHAQPATSTPTSMHSLFGSTLAPAPTTHAQPATSTPTSTHSLFGSTVTLAPAPTTHAQPATSTPTSMHSLFGSTLAPAPTTHAQPATSTPTSTHSLFGSTVTLAPAPTTHAQPATSTPTSMHSLFGSTLAPAPTTTLAQPATPTPTTNYTQAWQPEQNNYIHINTPDNWHCNNLTPAYSWPDNDSASAFLAENLAQSDGCCRQCNYKFKNLEQKITSLESRLAHLEWAQRQPGLLPAPSSTGTSEQVLYSRTSCISDQAFSISDQQNSKAINEPDATVHSESNDVELVPGYGIRISVGQLDTCLRKGKNSPTAVARLLLQVFFDDKTLAKSSVKGTKGRPALEKDIVDVIIKFVTDRMPCSERDLVQAMNCKCSESRYQEKK